jgi:hypothetical protein
MIIILIWRLPLKTQVSLAVSSQNRIILPFRPATIPYAADRAASGRDHPPVRVDGGHQPSGPGRSPGPSHQIRHLSHLLIHTLEVVLIERSRIKDGPPAIV